MHKLTYLGSSNSPFPSSADGLERREADAMTGRVNLDQAEVKDDLDA